MQNSELEKLKAAIKKLWDAANERKDAVRRTNHVDYAYEFGIITGLQALCLEMEWGEIEEWD